MPVSVTVVKISPALSSSHIQIKAMACSKSLGIALIE
jgi:hypothetical protein